MNIRTPLVLVTVAAAVLLVAAQPASAADTTTTFSLTGGTIALAVQPTATLTGAPSGTTGITGNLGAVTVTDLRGGAATWTVSAASTAFTGTGGSSSTAVSYTGGAVAETGTITVADGTATTLTGDDASVIAPSALSGNNTASWAPTLAVTMPAGALAGTYSGTVTTSIL